MITYLQKLISDSPNKMISYADFISEVLYHPFYGYYMKENQKIGRQGDFITTSNVSDLYGQIMAKWLWSVFHKLDMMPAICEIGAGNGRFAHAFLQEWSQLSNAPIRYLIVETSPYHRKLQRQLLEGFPSITQIDSLIEVERFEGIIFSNELFDALPVHVIEKENGKLVEIMVGYEKDRLIEYKVPLTNAAIYTFLQQTKLELSEHQRIEIPLAMDTILQQISAILTKGLVISADYGYTNEEWMDPRRKKGSLRGYSQHKMVDNVLEHPGDIDITTHVHFDYLIEKGNQLNLRYVSKLRQDEFLIKAGILKELEESYDPNPFSTAAKRNRSIRSLILPGGISSYFHMIIQQKGIQFDEAALFRD
ncbi:class I SAM-dependent methyltransferase [Neobacillus dielmonensis]|uniref:class I SAM-dependent methyltransferase n=1 Tax=Neobacillus dielmonensis TaxID=1347369 RepID=UPI0005A88C39|nr:SAM-dependent methyltransferase [Neobacillus dielmonensis]